ncbi:hypothetical protein FIA58_005255 [Flavobacterium jejuense]|uniref:Acyl-CoA thioesterase n=1 Tax=Flavobacterium jejuense TaxID=1544455 RepID=A0ABX0IPB9_9FLAO|nr:hypothetical protein [Flavobacterium jejuense]NHN25081.1 hypothetical protein [Flavobacterium jejuense]
MHYLVTHENYKKLIFLADNSVVAEMNYKDWFNSKPYINCKNGSNYIFEKPSVWKLDFIVKKNVTVLLEFSFNWNSSITIISQKKGIVKKMFVKMESIWKSNYILVNNSNHQ